MLVPFLFITVPVVHVVAFIALLPVAQPQQISRESDARRVTYGSMLLEGVLAVFALACVAVLSIESERVGRQWVYLLAELLSFSAVGVPLSEWNAMLAISTFLLTTLTPKLPDSVSDRRIV